MCEACEVCERGENVNLFHHMLNDGAGGQWVVTNGAVGGLQKDWNAGTVLYWAPTWRHPQGHTRSKIKRNKPLV